MNTDNNSFCHVTMRDMLKAGVHFGHRTRFWNPKMAPFIYGERFKVHIINLEHTLPLYRKAVRFLSKAVEKKGTILFVGTKRAARDSIRKQAERLGMPYVNYRWLGGMLTNYKTVRQSIKRLQDIEAMSTDGTFDKLTKKEVLSLTREQAKLERTLGGIKDMKRVPDAIFVVDVKHENIAVKEANKLGIPVVGIVDTNSDPAGIDYVIPGNDDAFRAIQLYLEGIVEACGEAKQRILTTGDVDDFIEVDTNEEAAKEPNAAVDSDSVKSEEASLKDTNKAEAAIEPPGDASNEVKAAATVD